MNKLYVVFKNRTNTLMFYDLVKKYRLGGRIVSTPKQISVSCGLSVELDYSSFNWALRIISGGNFNSFAGIYKKNIRNNYFEKVA